MGVKPRSGRLVKISCAPGSVSRFALRGPGAGRQRPASIGNFCPLRAWVACYPAAMDHLFTPWRYAYVSTAEGATSCIFCDRAPDPQQHTETDEKNYVVHRAQHNFVILNRYPYTCGHVMIVPYLHVDRLDLLPAAAANEMMALAQRMEGVYRRLYRPDGINLGMNIGKAAGAGVAGHIHMHMLPRWVADANFMSTVGETRVLPESLEESACRIRQALAESGL
jgi:ATP adenylyltransferase